MLNRSKVAPSNNQRNGFYSPEKHHESAFEPRNLDEIDYENGAVMGRAALRTAQSPDGQMLSSGEEPSTAYRHGEGQLSAEQSKPTPNEMHQMQYIQNIQNRMGVLDRSIDKILNVITHKGSAPESKGI